MGLSLLLIPCNAWWLVQMELIRYSAHPTTLSLFFNAVFVLLAITLGNALVGRVRPAAALRRGELYVVYTSVALASAVGGHDCLEILVPMLAWPFRHADRDGWDRFLPDLPKEWMVSDPAVYESYFRGNDTLYRWSYLSGWAGPALVWSLFLGALLLVMLCVNVLLRRQWTEYERLTYPILHLPLEIASIGPGGRLPALFHNRLFWIGCILAGGSDAINALNLYYPWIPTVLVPGRGASYLDLLPFLPGRPWTAVGWTPISWYPFAIGLGLLLPVDFLFSSWFFFLFWKLQKVGVAALAWDQDPQFPYPNAQAFGAYVAFCASTLWVSRHSLGAVARTVLGRPGGADDRREPIPYRWAVVGIGLGLAILTGYCLRLGMDLWLVPLFFAIYLVLALSITRMRAELGTPIHDLHFTGPDWMLSQAIGTRDLGQGNLTAFAMCFWFNRAYRGHPMPHQLEGFKLAEQAGGGVREYRRWFFWMLCCGVIGSLAGIWAMLHLNYDFGALARARDSYGNEAYATLASALANPKPGNPAVLSAALSGFAFALFLQAMRVRFPWWPFHPLGYAVTSSWEINLVWMPLFLAWVVKVVLLRYGGLPAYRRALPLFYGLMLGQFVVGSLLNLWGIATGTPTYQFWE